MPTTTERCYDIDGGLLRVSLKTDHSLSDREFEALDRVAESYVGCFEKVTRQMAADDDDRALWELGGVENICAG